jgi:DNA-binding response OmpR family regulator
MACSESRPAKAILIADDNRSDVDSVKRALNRAKVLNPVCSVDDGAAAIAYLDGEGIYSDRILHPYPAILLLDLKLPKVSGFVVLEWIKAHSRHQGLGVIVLTGSDDTRELAQVYQSGAHSFLIKPHSMARVLDLLTDIRGIHLDKTGAGAYLDFDLDRPQANRQASLQNDLNVREEGATASQPLSAE